MNNGIKPFLYSREVHTRRHGPSGYKTYESYRNWLRDEFAFRCVFCLSREQWYIINGNWDIDHFVPQCEHPDGINDYDNLLYVCHSCNVTKSSSQGLINPCTTVFGDCLKVNEDGSIEGLTDEGQILIEILRLDSKARRNWRRRMIDTLNSLAAHKIETYKEWLSYPEDLPNLKNSDPPGNNKPEGIENSYYELRLRGELPETY